MTDPRPRLTPHVEALLAALCASLDDLAGLDARAILVVAHGAHGTAAASVRTLDDRAKSVVVDGARRRIELALRPPFFLDGDAVRRTTTLIHELLHVDPARPGRLLDARRHAVRAHAAHDAHAAKLARRFIDDDPSLLAPLGHHGEVWMRTWRHRPVDETRRRTFTARDVVDAPIVMRTPARLRSVWW